MYYSFYRRKDKSQGIKVYNHLGHQTCVNIFIEKYFLAVTLMGVSMAIACSHCGQISPFCVYYVDHSCSDKEVYDS